MAWLQGDCPAGCSSNQSGLGQGKVDAHAPALDAAAGHGGPLRPRGQAAAANRRHHGNRWIHDNRRHRSRRWHDRTRRRRRRDGSWRCPANRRRGAGRRRDRNRRCHANRRRRASRRRDRNRRRSGTGGTGGATGAGGATRTGGTTRLAAPPHPAALAALAALRAGQICGGPADFYLRGRRVLRNLARGMLLRLFGNLRGPASDLFRALSARVRL